MTALLYLCSSCSGFEIMSIYLVWTRLVSGNEIIERKNIVFKLSS